MGCLTAAALVIWHESKHSCQLHTCALHELAAEAGGVRTQAISTGFKHLIHNLCRR